MCLLTRLANQSNLLGHVRASSICLTFIGFRPLSIQRTSPCYSNTDAGRRREASGRLAAQVHPPYSSMGSLDCMCVSWRKVGGGGGVED